MNRSEDWIDPYLCEPNFSRLLLLSASACLLRDIINIQRSTGNIQTQEDRGEETVPHEKAPCTGSCHAYFTTVVTALVCGAATINLSLVYFSLYLNL